MMIMNATTVIFGMENVETKERRRRRMWNCAPFDARFERCERRKTVR